MQTTCLLLLHSLHNTWRRASGSQSWSCSLRSTSLALCLTHALFGLPARQPSHLTTQALTAHTLALALHRNSPASAQHAGRARVRTAARRPPPSAAAAPAPPRCLPAPPARRSPWQRPPGAAAAWRQAQPRAWRPSRCAPAPCRKRHRVSLWRVLTPCSASARCAGSILAALVVRCRSPAFCPLRRRGGGAAHLIDSEASRVWLRADLNSAVSACSCLRTASRASSCASAASCTTALPPAPHWSQPASPHAARTVTRRAPPARAPRTPAHTQQARSSTHCHEH